MPLAPNRAKQAPMKEGSAMATLDWSQCVAVESIPGKVSGAWVFRGTRLPVATVIENLEDLSIEEVMEQFDVTREQITAVLDFVAQSLKTATPSDPSAVVDAHSL
jgi:uncharacterized protein (DUF433 family)